MTDDFGRNHLRGSVPFNSVGAVDLVELELKGLDLVEGAAGQLRVGEIMRDNEKAIAYPHQVVYRL